ncbi:MAG: serine/threonine protein kinase [Oscillospiraceae bacterium]|nr:serine/threonine protein kinase [Oscillospiraceae bacterium]
MKEYVQVNGRDYEIVKLLGHGKGGYSYLARRENMMVVLKQIHHEPCDYYTFGNKIEAERNDYRRLLAAGIRIPRMLEIDVENERIVKEFIDGDTAAQLVQAGTLTEEHLRQVREMAELAMAAGLNIDYYPTNFIMQDGLLYYIDYECNPYDEQWSFERWGAQYWSSTAAEE